jgi:predicted RNA binding protein YcfA (HicA-like mRNA interferase family)
MSQWLATKARRVLAALLRIGWRVKRQVRSSHRILERSGWPDVVFAFHDSDEIGPRMRARLAKHTGLTPGRAIIGLNCFGNGERCDEAVLRGIATIAQVVFCGLHGHLMLPSRLC